MQEVCKIMCYPVPIELGPECDFGVIWEIGIMDAELKRYCELLSENRNVTAKVFPWESDLMRISCGAVFASGGKKADRTQLQQCREILERKAGAFSEFRGILRLTVLAKMALAPEPAAYFQKLNETYRFFFGNPFLGGEYRLLAAIQILDAVEFDSISEVVARTYAIHERMRKEHPWLADQGDFPMAAVLASRRLNPEILFEEMEACYHLLTQNFHAGDSAQVCAHILAVSGTSAERKCSKLFEIWDSLKQGGHRYGSGKELAILAALAALDQPTENIVQNIIKADELLKTKKGFGFFGIGTAQRRMYAAQAVLNTYAQDGCKVEASVISGSVALSIAQAVCASIIATTAASTAASNAS